MDIDRQRMTEIVEVRLRLPKILTARCVMLANYSEMPLGLDNKDARHRT